MIETLRAVALILATISMGVMAGVFQVYSYAIMPGLSRTTDRTFVGAFQRMDGAIINPLFFANFFGALVLTGLAALLHMAADVRSVLPWAAAAFVLYLIAFVVTIAVNVPLNDGIKAAGDPEQGSDAGAIRQRFNEAKWLRWNHLRALLTTAALACLAWALILNGRG